ncbi:unnamed protein product [Peniophora sp. CBMAI 1063]|nr:unnamed protein product [Peniophora sp. CBMAI 1063]
MDAQAAPAFKIEHCYVALTIGYPAAATWYASVLDPFIMEKERPLASDVAFLCNHLERWGPNHRQLVVRAGPRVPAASQITRIRQANQASNKKDMHNVWTGADWKMVGLLDFVPERPGYRIVIPSLWSVGSPYTFTFTPDHPPLFFCHDLKQSGLQLGLRLQELLIHDGKRLIAPHENAVKCALAKDQGRLPPPVAMREDFGLAIWVPGCGRPYRACMHWESQLTKVRPGYEYQPTMARLAKNVTQFLIEAMADAEKQGEWAPYLNPKYDTLLIGLMQLSAEPQVWQPILECLRI